MKNVGNASQDQVFKDEIMKVSDFKFGTTVVNVFDDMVSRSVPFYNETQRMLAEIAADHVNEGTFVYDLGCSTGTTLIEVDKLIPFRHQVYWH
jgi:tRNA (cmo5U34)-methyltransferase